MKKNLKIIGWFALIVLIVVVVSYPIYTAAMLNRYDFQIEDIVSSFYRSSDYSLVIVFRNEEDGIYSSYEKNVHFVYEKQSNILIAISKEEVLEEEEKWQKTLTFMSIDKLYCLEDRIYFYKVVSE